MMLRGHSFTLGGRSAQAGVAATAPGGSAGGGGGGSGSAVVAGAPPVVKQMNNYLGVGVDAKVGAQPASLSGGVASLRGCSQPAVCCNQP